MVGDLRVGEALEGSAETWRPSLNGDEYLPGWFAVPKADDSEESEWVAQATAEILKLHASEGVALSAARSQEYETVLRSILKERRLDDSDVSFAAFPGPRPSALLVSLNVVSSHTLPSWDEVGAVVHPIDARYLGPGIQCATRQFDHQSGIEFTSLHAVFDNGRVAVMLSISESIAPLVTSAIPGFLLFMNALSVTGSSGTPFKARRPVVELDPLDFWPFSIGGTK